ncbi:hypothetical protein KJ750_00705 [Patescibacteria group bacterium]|nr:hypothetical protein [Patescibacteria group bacterium]MBU2263167.1 hypothetical protein [Patescibacteria group bacterium]
MGKIIWTREGYVCPHCGTPNPDGGDKCGNCDENPYVLPSKDEKLTEGQLRTLRMVTGARH